MELSLTNEVFIGDALGLHFLMVLHLAHDTMGQKPSICREVLLSPFTIKPQSLHLHLSLSTLPMNDKIGME